MAAAVVDMTGGVLALASYPTYDLSTFRENYSQLQADESYPLNNRATMGLYAPGSTFKMLTAIAALDSGTITTLDKVECTAYYRFYPDVSPACWIAPGRHGMENVTQAIQDSCNIFFYDVGRRTGIATIREYAQKFGLGEYTGIEIPEKKGHVAGPETSASYDRQWFEGETMYAAIGQDNNLFSPLQLANYIATLVNGGNHHACHLLKEFKSSDYSQITETYDEPPLHTVDIQPEHLAAIKQGMYDLSKTPTMARWFDSLRWRWAVRRAPPRPPPRRPPPTPFSCASPPTTTPRWPCAWCRREARRAAPWRSWRRASWHNISPLTVPCPASRRKIPCCTKAKALRTEYSSSRRVFFHRAKGLIWANQRK